MTIKAFISHSSADKDFVRHLVDLLGRDYFRIDCYDFDSAYRTMDEINRSIEESTQFILLISKDSLSSPWVEKEIGTAKRLLRSRFWPFIIDRQVSLEDVPGWIRDEDVLNLKYYDTPELLARDIEQKFRKIVWGANPLTKMRESVLAGRNADIDKFENKYLSGKGNKLRAVLISGRDGVGKDFFAKQCAVKTGYSPEIEPFRILMQDKDRIENFIIYLNMIAGDFNEDSLKDLLSKPEKEKISAAITLINHLLDMNSVIFIQDSFSCILPTKDIPEWLNDILSSTSLNSQIGLYILSKIAPHPYIEADHPQICHIPLLPLDTQDRKKLFYLAAKSFNINIPDADADYFVKKLMQSPEQILEAVQVINTSGLNAAKKGIDLLVSKGDKRIGSILKEFTHDELEVILTLSKFEYLKFSTLELFFEERYDEALRTVNKLYNWGFASYFGPSEEFVRLDASLCDYVYRNKLSLPADLDLHINDVLNTLLANEPSITEDSSLFLYDIKKRLLSGKSTHSDYMIPSIVIKSIMDLYNRKEYEDVICLCDIVLKDNHYYYDSEVVREIEYWLCLALCRRKNTERFKEEVHKVDGNDFNFLWGFYNRLMGDYEAAKNSLDKVLQKSPNHRRARREMVSVLIMQGQYPDALKLAEANYKSDPDNTYHILAFFRCLVRKPRLDADDIKTLNELKKAIENNFSPKKDSILAAMDIDYKSYVSHIVPQEIVKIIDEYKCKYPQSKEIERAANEYYYKQNIHKKRIVVEED